MSKIFIGWASINNPAQGDAGDVLETYVTMQIPIYACASHVRNGEFVIRVDFIGDFGDVRTVLGACALRLLRNMVEYIVGWEVAEGSISVEFAAEGYATEYADYLHRPVEFGTRRIEYRLPVGLRSVTNSAAKKATYNLAFDQCRAASTKLRHTKDVPVTVYNMQE